MIFVLHLNNLSLTISIFMSAKRKNEYFRHEKCVSEVFFSASLLFFKNIMLLLFNFYKLETYEKSIFLHIKNNLYSFFVFVCFDNIILAQHNQAHCFSICVLYYLFSQCFITLCVFLNSHNAIFLIDFRSCQKILFLQFITFNI